MAAPRKSCAISLFLRVQDSTPHVHISALQVPLSSVGILMPLHNELLPTVTQQVITATSDRPRCWIEGELNMKQAVK
jgi:hypothetical protein